MFISQLQVWTLDLTKAFVQLKYNALSAGLEQHNVPFRSFQYISWPWREQRGRWQTSATLTILCFTPCHAPNWKGYADCHVLWTLETYYDVRGTNSPNSNTLRWLNTSPCATMAVTWTFPSGIVCRGARVEKNVKQIRLPDEDRGQTARRMNERRQYAQSIFAIKTWNEILLID